MSANRTFLLEKAAFDLGLSFTPKDEWGLLRLLLDFQLFSRGHSKRISNILRKEDDWLHMDASVFDYRYTISAGNSHRIFKQSVFFMHSKNLALPQFLMKPEGFFHKIGQWLGLQEDIDFEEFSAFSDQYFLKGQDEAFVRSSMNAETLRFFTIEKNWNLEGVNYFLIFYRKNKLLPPDQIKDFYQKGMKICELLSQEKE